MKIQIREGSIKDFDGDLLIINLFEGVRAPAGATGTIDRGLSGVITNLIGQDEITGKLGQCSVIHTLGRLSMNKIMVVGLGKAEEFGLEAIRKASAAVIKEARRFKAKRVGTIVHGAGIGGITPIRAARALIEGALLGLYEFAAYKKSNGFRIEELTILEKDHNKIADFKKGAELGRILAEAQNCARDLINEPANELTPVILERRIRKIVKDFKLDDSIKCQTLGRVQLQKMGMGALLSVTQGSDNEPAFIVLRYKRSQKPLVCLIGKTVTFDSGGISIKPSSGMDRMKGDMSGGAAVIGATLALAKTRVNVNLMTIVPAVENMPSGKASRPGDVVRAMNGKTIEIISTDAEGRMTLADAISYAETQKAGIIIDIATLTGACVVALGEITSAVMTNDQKLVDDLNEVSQETGEKFWPLPLFQEYEELIKSDIADIKNSGGRSAGTITAGIFLKNFIARARWLHIDMAGKEIAEKENFYQPKGGTGFGVRSLFELCRRLS